MAAVLVRRQHGQAELVEGGAAAESLGVYRHVQFLELVVVLPRHAPVGVHHLIYQLVLAMEVFGGVSQAVGGAGDPLAVFDVVFHHPAVAPRVDAAGRPALAVVFPMEAHARLVGEFRQLVSLVAEAFHRSQRVLRGYHVTRLVIAVAHEQCVLAVGHQVYSCDAPLVVRLHVEGLATRIGNPVQPSARAVMQANACAVGCGHFGDHPQPVRPFRPPEAVGKPRIVVTDSIARLFAHPFQVFAPVVERLADAEEGACRLTAVPVAERHAQPLHLAHAHAVAVVPVVAQRPVHLGVAVIGAFPHDGDGAGQLEVHVGVEHPARGGIHGFAEEPAVGLLL